MKTSSSKVIIPLIVAFLIQCQNNSSIQQLKIVETILHDNSSFFYLDTQNYPAQNKDLPIGVFDSGTGGLTVLDAIVNFDQYDNGNHSLMKDGDGHRDFQSEYFIYLADQANMPYGIYSGENKTDLLKEHIIKDVQFLLGSKYYSSQLDSIYQTDKAPVKAIVIACNTATAYGKTEIEKFLGGAELDIKVIGVIGAGVRGALSHFRKDEDGTIGIMATAGTVASGGYVNTINSQRATMKLTGNIAVFQQAGIGLAGAIDGA
ncbi:MAG: aspartate/glutamate racemase family protein, partial [bacterium]